MVVRGGGAVFHERGTPVLARVLRMMIFLLFFVITLEPCVGTKVYEPEIRALLGTGANFYKVVCLKLRTTMNSAGDSQTEVNSSPQRRETNFK